MNSQALLVALMATVISPAILAIISNHLTSRQRRAEKKLDWAREDAVAEQAEKAAKLLLQSNVAVAKSAADNAEKVLFGLERIHTLVNSDMTAARSEQRDQARLTLAGLRTIIRLDEDAGREPSQDDLDAIDAAEKTIKKLDTILADRLAQQRKVEVQQQQQQQQPRQT